MPTWALNVVEKLACLLTDSATTAEVTLSMPIPP